MHWFMLTTKRQVGRMWMALWRLDQTPIPTRSVTRRWPDRVSG